MRSTSVARSALASPLKPLGEERGEAHFARQVEPVVAGGTIGAEADIDAELSHLCDRRKTAGQLQIGCRAVRHVGACRCQQGEFAFVQVLACTPIKPGPSRPRSCSRASGRLPCCFRLSSISCRVSWIWQWIGRFAVPIASGCDRSCCRTRCRVRAGRGRSRSADRHASVPGRPGPWRYSRRHRWRKVSGTPVS